MSHQATIITSGQIRAAPEKLLEVAGRICFGAALCCFFVPAALAGAVACFLPPAVKRVTVWILVAVSLPLVYMGIIAEIASPDRAYGFYYSGRIITYFFPAVYLALSAGLAACPVLAQGRGRWLKVSVSVVLCVYFLIANADVFGFRGLYHLFNFRSM